LIGGTELKIGKRRACQKLNLGSHYWNQNIKRVIVQLLSDLAVVEKYFAIPGKTAIEKLPNPLIIED